MAHNLTHHRSIFEGSVDAKAHDSLCFALFFRGVCDFFY